MKSEKTEIRTTVAGNFGVAEGKRKKRKNKKVKREDTHRDRDTLKEARAQMEFLKLAIECSREDVAKICCGEILMPDSAAKTLAESLKSLDRGESVNVQDEMITAPIIVTPHLAWVLLNECNDRNRKPSESTVKKYASHMQNDVWKFRNPQSNLYFALIECSPDDSCKIKFVSQDGSRWFKIRLLDGQQRMRSIIESKKPQSFKFCFGVPQEKYDVFDQNKVRTTANAGEVEGIENAKDLAAGLKLLHYYREGLVLPMGGTGFTLGWNPTMFLKLYGELGDEVCKRAVSRARELRKHFGPSVKKSVIIAASLVEDSIDAGMAEGLFTKLMALHDKPETYGIVKENWPTDPVIALKNTLDECAKKGKKGRKVPQVYFNYFVKAWNHTVDSSGIGTGRKVMRQEYIKDDETRMVFRGVEKNEVKDVVKAQASSNGCGA